MNIKGMVLLRYFFKVNVLRRLELTFLRLVSAHVVTVLCVLLLVKSNPKTSYFASLSQPPEARFEPLSLCQRRYIRFADVFQISSATFK